MKKTSSSSISIWRRGYPGAGRGFTLAEMVACLLVLSMAMILIVEVVARVAAERRLAEQRLVALTEANARLERLGAQPPGSWITVAPSLGELSPTARRVLPAGTLAVEVDEAADSPGLTRIQVVISWNGRHESPVEPVRLSAWFANPSKVQHGDEP